MTERITHGRHCVCTACAREDWTQPHLACCGMHGPSCPPVYAPLGGAGDLVNPPVADPSVVDAPNEGDSDADSSQVLDAQVQGEVQGHLGARQPSDVVGEAGVTAGPLEPSVVDALNTLREGLHVLYAYTSDQANPPGGGRSETHANCRAALAVVETALADKDSELDDKDDRIHADTVFGARQQMRAEEAEARAVAAEAERDTLRQALEQILHEVGSVAQSPKDAAAAANRIARAVLAGEEPT